MITTYEIENILREKGLLCRADRNECPVPVKWVTCDSREVVPGTLFICKGAEFRPEYLLEAIECGCVAYVSEVRRVTPPSVRGFVVKDIRKAMAEISAVFFEYRPDSLKLTAITGTKGKTTTAWYLKAMLDEWQKEEGKPETGLVSSVMNFDGFHKTDAVMTTPEAPTLHEMIAKVRVAGSRYMTIETSSQALKYDRVYGLKFQVGVFLNISEDHISPAEHQDLEDYFQAKLSLFSQCEAACVNLDSDHAERIVNAAKQTNRVVTFGQNPEAELRYDRVRMKEDRLSFRVIGPHFTERFSLKMKGSFNIENAMAAISAAYVYGVPVLCMKRALEETWVPGRMEVFETESRKICAIVDYAHNRLSFRKLFHTVFSEYGSYRKIITVFGCPGGKAFNRRMELGMIAGMFSDYVYLTSDNPGTENCEEIAAEVQKYVEMTGGVCEYAADRKKAISLAMHRAAADEENTIILVLGRGDEKFQKIGRRMYEYPSDACIVQEVISGVG